MSKSLGDTYTISENELHEISMLIQRMQFIADVTSSSHDRITTTSPAIAATVEGVKETLQRIQDGITHRHHQRELSV